MCDAKAQAVLNNLSEKGIDTSMLGSPSLEQAPQNPPLTRVQFEECSKYWPCSFHEDKEYVNFCL